MRSAARATSVTPEASARALFLPLALTMGTAVGVINLLESHHLGRRVITDCCVVTTTQPWPSLFLRLPGAALAAAPNLPAWGAVVQVLVVVGMAERAIGWRRSLGIGLLCHVLASLAGRAMWSLTYAAAANATMTPTRDTGPSVFVLGLGIYLLRDRFRRSWSTVALVGVLVLAAGWSDLAGVEHVVGAATGWALAEANRRNLGLRDGLRLRAWRSTPRSEARPVAWVRTVSISLGVAVLCTALWHTNDALAVSAAHVDRARGITAIAVTNRATLPVQLAVVQVGSGKARDAEVQGWWARDRSCVHIVNPRHTWLWHSRLWWCSQLAAHGTRGRHLRLHYWIVGVHQTLRLG